MQSRTMDIHLSKNIGEKQCCYKDLKRIENMVQQMKKR